MSLRHVAWMLLPVLAAACSDFDESDPGVDHHESDDDGSIGSVSSALTATSPVSSAVTQACSTTAVKELSLQLVQEIQCLKPGSMKRIDDAKGLVLGSAVFPYLQTPAANALVAAQQARGVPLSINSGLRTLPQQYLLYRWYQTGRCGIGLAARPGTSNHESGIAVDIKESSAWQSAFTAKGFSWLGAKDPVHFDYKAGGAVNMKGLSVLAFQRLWNRNNPKDRIDEDGAYGPQTEARLAKAPIGGFPVGAVCSKTLAAPGDGVPGDGPLGDDEEPFAEIPDATEPSVDDAPVDTAADETTFEPLQNESAGEQGCSLAPASNGRTAAGPFAAGLVGAALLLRRRRRAG